MKNFLEVIKELYGFPASGKWWHINLSHNLRGMGFNLTHFDPNVWIKGQKGSYNYIGTPIMRMS